MSDVRPFVRKPRPGEQPPTIDGMTEHLFEYEKVRDGHDGKVWGISVWAENEADARDRLRRASEGAFLGVCHKVIPA
jgi:hypothetical protein